MLYGCTTNVHTHLHACLMQMAEKQEIDVFNKASGTGGSCPGAAPEIAFVCSCTVCIMACTASDQFEYTPA